MCTIFLRSPLISLFMEKSVDIRSLNLSLDSIDLEILLSDSVLTDAFYLLFLNLLFLSCEN
jgi:type II restriction/modification system DNA methylase subunit YeeA